MSAQLRSRQIHLDFHTSEHCMAVGSKFNADRFADTLKAANVNSINIFAKCHHGYSYFPTKIGKPHPHLMLDLLGMQIEALHRRDILCPIYYSILWDELAGQEHPDWVIVNKDGTVASRAPLSNEWGWTTLDVSSGYRDYVFGQVGEILDNYPVDGFWFDICFPKPNYSTWGKAQMVKAGVDVEDEQAVWEFARKKQTDFFDVMTKFIHNRCPNATVFYNGTIDRDVRRVQPYMTHLEVESLPTTGQWGYLHYPISARQARNYGKDFVGMNGRFHTSWGDFGGLKTHDQLEYECATIVAAGGKICVGDQLHPSGELDAAVYRLIGQTFARFEALEPWLTDVQPRTEIAILATGEAETRNPGIAAHSPDTEGAAQVFLELAYQFDVIDEQADFSRYPALVVPDGTRVDATLKSSLERYLADGGRLILSGTAALNADASFALDAIPVEYLQLAPTKPSYARPDSAMLSLALNAGVMTELSDDYDYAFYGQSHMVKAKAGATAYGSLSRALFNRTWKHFMGHLHAPVGESLDTPVAVRNSNVLYLAVPFFSGYRHHDYWAYRTIMQTLLLDFLPPQILKPNAPGWVEFSVLQQNGNTQPAREIVHVIGYHPRRTMHPIAHVDQSGEINNLSFTLRTDKCPNRVYLAPEGVPVDFSYQDGCVEIRLLPVRTHAVVVVE
jgi:hypothetical protein